MSSRENMEIKTYETGSENIFIKNAFTIEVIRSESLKSSHEKVKICLKKIEEFTIKILCDVKK